MNKKLSRDDFFGNEKIQKMAHNINKRVVNGYNFIYVRDLELMGLVQSNLDWLDFIGIYVDPKQSNEKVLVLRWKGA